MALKEKGMVRTFDGSSDYELEAKTGESLLIRGIYVDNADEDIALAYIDKTTVGVFQVGGLRGNHLFYRPVADITHGNVLEYLWNKGIFNGYPVAEGQTFILKGFQGSGTKCTVVYDKYDAGDMRADQENGSEATEYFFINYGQPETAPSSAGDILIDDSIVPAEFPQFPFGLDVPAKTEIDIYGFLASDATRVSGSGANINRTRFLKLIKERVVLFDDNKQGIINEGVNTTTDGYYYGQGISLMGYHSNVDRRELFLLSEPLTFASGEELNIYHTIEITGSANFTSEDLRIGVICKVRRVS